ncbi:MAG: APC family permease [Candidatus Rokubacteria bacterium]|nr:APC family permease [Candidatus Rokubacteria bacterium]
MTSPLKRELGLVPLAAIVFFNVSGGPYGIEDMVPAFGPGLTLLLLLLTPVLWSLPVSLAMSELAGAMPDEGGYVTWVERAFGPFWGFQVGWWSWIDSFVDVAVYPALFVEYSKFWWPEMGALERWLLALAFILGLTVLNVLGVRPVGRAAVVLAAAALAPVALFVVVGAPSARAAPWLPLLPESQTLGTGLGLGLAVVMWNYSGWDTPSTCLGETRAPERAFRAALFVSLPVIAGAYVLPVAVAQASGASDWKAWETGSLPVIAAATGGAWLGHAVAAGAVLSTAGLFMSLLLTNSRLPYVLARDGLMPAWLAAVHPRFGTPWAAVGVSAAFYGAFALFSFRDLIVLDVWLYSVSLVVELAAFVWLRARAPGMARPWTVPGGWTGAIAVAAFPSAFAGLAMATAGWDNTVAGLAGALSGPLAYAALRRRRG